MKYSIVPLCNIDIDNRIDSEYFEPEFLNIFEILKKKQAKSLNNYCNITASAFYPAATELYEYGDIPFIRCVDCVNFPIISYLQDKSFEKIPLSFFNSCDNIKELKRYEVVITKVGTPCYASILTDYEKVALSRTVLGLINITDINPFYLTIFLRSKYGYYQLIRERELTIQYQLTLDRVGNILIYKPSENNFMSKIENIFKTSILYNKNSKNCYEKTEKLLLTTLNMYNWELKHELSYVKNFSDVKGANRFDAEYFQPKYDEIIKKVKSYSNGWSTLEEIVNINDNNIIPKDNIEYEYIELSNISNQGEITGTTKDLGKNLPTRARRIVKTGDVIVSSIEGSLSSVALITEQYNNCLCSNGFYIINSEYYNSETLLCLIKSIIGQLQLKKGCSGTILSAISKEELNKIILPKIKQETQNIIKEKVQNMYKLRNQSKQLLEIAKRGVEIAIEENEEFATSWINEQLLKIGVEL